MNIIEKADKYADGKANEAITKAIAQAYLDGYRDGYNDRENEIPADFRNNKTTYIDLGLPSRTLWSEDYEKDGDNILYLPYERADYCKIPTKEQWEELLEQCEWQIEVDRDYDFVRANFVGPNGNILVFEKTGKEIANELTDNWHAFFWIEEEYEGNDKGAVHLFNKWKSGKNKALGSEIMKTFSGYHLPVRLVR
jgi:hypothetical protein